LQIVAISVAAARDYFNMHSAFRGHFDIAIGAADEPGGEFHGVIALSVNGDACIKRQISTDGNAQVGSLLYGAAVRVAMALGYKALEFGE